MTLKHYTSNDSEILANKLSGNINSNKSVFKPHFIISAHQSTNAWLTEHIANKNGIAAHLFYQRPEEFVSMIYNVLEAGTAQRELLATKSLVWLIDHVLGSAEFKAKPEHKTVVLYIDDDEMKRFTLSEKILHLFEEYQTKEPDMIRKWNNNQLADLGEDLKEAEIWQRYIWNALKALAKAKISDFTQMMDAIYKCLEDPEKVKVLLEKVADVSFFGNLPYTPEYIKLLQTLGEKTDIRICLYHQNFFDKNESVHRLVKNLGAFGIKQNKLFDNLQSEVLQSTYDTSAANLLQTLQEKIKGKEITYIDDNKKDDSITISNCFSINREVEALYHYLIRQFKENSSLGMRDICVITPDIEKYAPAVKSFFSSKDFPIEFNFYDTSHKIKASPYLALEALLNLDTDTFTSRQLLGLLEFNFIRDRFGFNEDIGLLTRAVKAANIRHGIEGNPELETDLVAWRYGLKRLIYGFCLEPKEELVEINDTTFFPVTEFEDRDTLELLRLYEFVEELDMWIQNRKAERSLAEWVTFITEMTLVKFLDMKDYESFHFTKLLSDWMHASAFVENDKISFRVIHYHLSTLLNSMEGGEKKGFGGVRFVSPNAYLSTPASIYAFLGLNGSDFPRKTTRLSFDLSSKTHPTPTDLDKNLFLNILLASRKKCYLSFIGQSVKDNSRIPPSTLLEELLTSLKESLLRNKDSDEIITKHPLHGFSMKYNRAGTEDKLYRFEKRIENENDSNFPDQEIVSEILKSDEEGRTIIPLKDLIDFLIDPVKHFYNKKLGVYYPNNEDNEAEVESFELNTLEEWAVMDNILGATLTSNSKNDDEIYEELLRSGKLPLKNFGKATFERCMKKVKGVIEKIGGFSGQTPRSQNIDIKINGFRIKGTVDNIYDSTLLFSTVSSDKLKYRIRAWVSFLCLSQELNPLKLLYVTKDKGKIKENVPANSIELLENYCTKYKEGWNKLILFSCEFDESRDKILNINTDQDSVLDIKLKGILNNPYNRSSFPSNYFLRELNNNSLQENQKVDEFLSFYRFTLEMYEFLN